MSATAVELGTVNGCHSVGEWQAFLQQGSESKKLVVVDFTASWCGPCRFIAPVFVELAKKFQNVLFLKVDVDELKTVAAENNVEAMPTFVFLKEGKEVDRLMGAKKDDLMRLLEKHAQETGASVLRIA